MASKCHVGPCSACNTPRYTHPAAMKEKNREVYNLLKFLWPELSDTAYVSAPCAKQLSRNVSNENFYPQWLPKSAKSSDLKYNTESCQNIVHTDMTLMTASSLKEMLHERVTAFTIASGQEQVTVALCADHYQRMYRHLHQSRLPKKSESFTWHCPAPHKKKLRTTIFARSDAALV